MGGQVVATRSSSAMLGGAPPMGASTTRPLPPSPILITPDARRRVTFPALPGIDPNQALEVVPERDGSYRLVPIVTIPRNQLWAWTPEAMIQDGKLVLLSLHTDHDETYGKR